jgi:hypothetical protein
MAGSCLLWRADMDEGQHVASAGGMALPLQLQSNTGSWRCPQARHRAHRTCGHCKLDTGSCRQPQVRHQAQARHTATGQTSGTGQACGHRRAAVGCHLAITCRLSQCSTSLLTSSRAAAFTFGP